MWRWINIFREEGLLMENDYAALINILGNFGFPVMITIYLFVRFEKKIENLASVISELKNAVKELKK